MGVCSTNTKDSNIKKKEDEKEHAIIKKVIQIDMRLQWILIGVNSLLLTQFEMVAFVFGAVRYEVSIKSFLYPFIQWTWNRLSAQNSIRSPKKTRLNDFLSLMFEIESGIPIF